MSATIRDAQLADLPRIVEIYNASIPGRMSTADLEPVTADSRRRWFKEHNSTSRPLWVLEVDGDIVAWVSLSNFVDGRGAYDATAEISIYVDPDVQKQGYGRMLLTQMLESCREFGVTSVIAMYFDHNIPGRKLCKELGFVDRGHLVKIAEIDGRKRGVVIGVKTFDA